MIKKLLQEETQGQERPKKRTPAQAERFTTPTKVVRWRKPIKAWVEYAKPTQYGQEQRWFDHRG